MKVLAYGFPCSKLFRGGTNFALESYPSTILLSKSSRSSSFLKSLSPIMHLTLRALRALRDNPLFTLTSIRFNHLKLPINLQFLEFLLSLLMTKASSNLNIIDALLEFTAINKRKAAIIISDTLRRH